MKGHLTCALVLALGLWNGVARGADASARDQARSHFKTGLSLAEAGELQGALDAFRQAYDTSPNYAVLYNLGRAYEALGRSVEAVHTLERFLAEGGNDIEPGRRQEVEAIVERERATLARAEIVVSPQEAEVFLDGVRLGPAPLGPQDVVAGEHVLAARMPGLLPHIEAFTLKSGELGRLSLVLEPEAPPSLGPLPQPAPVRGAPPPPPVVDTTSHRNWALGVGIGGVVLTSAAIATFAWNNGRYDDWQQDRARFEAALAGGATGPPVSSAAAALRDRALAIQRVDDLALGMAVAAGCALVTSGVLWLTTLAQGKAGRAATHSRP